MGGVVKSVVQFGLKNVISDPSLAGIGFSFNPWTFVAKLAVTLAVQSAFNAVAGKRKPTLPSPAFEEENETRKTMVRSTVAHRSVMYGETLTSGPIIFADTSGTDNKYLHLVIPISHTDYGYGINSIDKVYLNDTAITLSTDLDGSNVVNTGNYNGKVRIKTALGKSTQTADSDAVSEITNWGSNHIGKGVSYCYLRLEYNQDTFPTGIPNVRVQAQGMRCLDTRYTTFAANTVINTSTEIFTISSHSFSTGDGWIYNNAGNSNIGGLTSGTTYYVIKVDANTFKLATSLANAEAGTAVNITSSPSETHKFQKITFSKNPAVIIRHYLTSDYGLNLSDDEVDTTSFDAAANVCDETITNKDTTTSNRYECGGMIDLGKTPMDIIAQLLTSCVGLLVYEQGTYKLFTGAATSSVKTFTEDNLRGEVQVRTKPSKKELYNAIKGTFQDSNNQYHSSEFELQTNSTYETADGSERIIRDIELPFTSSRLAAQRIARLHLNKSRQAISVDLPCNMSAMEVSVGDTISLTLSDLGWTAKEFKVLEWNLSNDGGIDLRLQEEASSVYSWTSADDETTTDAAPNTTLPSSFSVTAPDTIAVSDTLASFYDGQVVPATTITIASTDPYSQFFEVTYKLSSDSTYILLGEGRQTTFTTHQLKEGSTYDIRARARNYVGVYSGFTTTSYTVVGELDPPSTVTNFACNIIGEKAYLSWDPVTDLDLAFYEIRYSTATSGADWFNSVVLIEKVSRPGTSTTVPARVGSYLIKAVDKMGNYSIAETIAISTIASLTGLNLVTTTTQHSGFTGTKTNCVIDTATTPDELILSSTTNFDDLLVTTLDGAINNSVTSVTLTDAGNFPDGAGTILIGSEQITYTGKSTNTLTGCTRGANSTSAASHVDDVAVKGFIDDAEIFFDSGGASGTVATEGTYEFDSVVDLGAVVTSRLFPTISQTVTDRTNLFDNVADSFFDSRSGSFDGDAVSSCTSILYFAYSDDNSSYSDFQKALASSDVTARYLKFKLVMTSNGDASPEVSALSVEIDMVDKIVSEKDKSIGSSGTAITFPNSGFKVTPMVAITIQSSATGDYFTLSSISATGFTCNIYNSSAAGKTGTINYLARGY